MGEPQDPYLQARRGLLLAVGGLHVLTAHSHQVSTAHTGRVALLCLKWSYVSTFSNLWGNLQSSSRVWVREKSDRKVSVEVLQWRGMQCRIKKKARCDRWAVLLLMIVFLQIIRAPASKMDCPICLHGKRSGSCEQLFLQHWVRQKEHCLHPWHWPTSTGQSLFSTPIQWSSHTYRLIIRGKLIRVRSKAVPTDNHISITAKCTVVLLFIQSRSSSPFIKCWEQAGS